MARRVGPMSFGGEGVRLLEKRRIGDPAWGRGWLGAPGNGVGSVRLTHWVHCSSPSPRPSFPPPDALLPSRHLREPPGGLETLEVLPTCGFPGPVQPRAEGGAGSTAGEAALHPPIIGPMHATVSPMDGGATESARPRPLGDVPVSEIELHGHRVTYRQVGEGPVLVLIHGVTGNMQTWDEALPWLADRFTVVTPDLLGHGLSAKPRGDYSLGAYASGIRDLLGALGHFRATVVGHSLGGGIAMQMAYQFPEHCERLVLVSSGGLGEEVSIALRAATLPGSELVIPLIAHNSVIEAGRTVGRWLDVIGLGVSPDKAEIARGYASLSDPEARGAFIHTMRAVIDHRGQRVSARDRLYLTEALPSMLLWGARDPIIPVAHGERAHEEMPGSWLEVFEDAGHFPHVTEPRRFARMLIEFVEATDPAELDNQRMRDVLLGGARR